MQTHQQAATGSTPYQHQMLDDKNKARALWIEAIDSLYTQSNAVIHDPEDFIPVNIVHSGNNHDTSLLPDHIIDCFNTIHKNHDDKLPCFNAWIAQNYAALNQPHDAPDTDSPKWADALKSNRQEEWLSSLGDEFHILIKQEVFDEIPCTQVPMDAQILSSGVVTKVKHDEEGKEAQLKSCVVVHGN
ncbi:hypothetical protein OPQ81_003827 [Rhizoctonia solani]|nr:hypothetical protein OPQ81_003827 [Rhizoctonia solani]